MSTLLTVALLLASAEPDPAALLRKVDAAAARATDTTLTMHVSVSTKGSDPLERELKAWQLGADKRLIKFLGPARLRGTGILVPERGQTYLYLPAYQRVRRVVGRQGSTSFMGMGFSINDLARVRFSDDYRAALAGQGDDHQVLKLTPTDPEAHTHAFVEITVRKADHLVSKIKTLDASGKALRTIDASDFKEVGDYTVAHRIRIEEHEDQRVTVATIKDVRFDTGLTAADFTERQLRRAP